MKGIVNTQEFSKDGIIESDESGIARIRYERHLNHTIAKVWTALTEPTSIFEFFTTINLSINGELSINFGHEDPERYLITSLEPPTLLEYRNVNHPSWKSSLTSEESKDYPEKYFIERWELIDQGEACLLIFTTYIGPNDPTQLRNSVGWHVYLDMWEQLLDGADKTSLESTAFDKERQIAGPYIKQLTKIYPGWRYK